MEIGTGEKEMTKKDRDTLGEVLNVGITLLGMYFWNQTRVGGAVGFFIIIIITATAPGIILSYIIPTKQDKKTTNKKGNKVSKKTKGELEYVLKGIIFMVGFWIFWELNLSWHFFFGLLIIVAIVPTLIVSMIPDKQDKKPTTKTSPKKTDSAPSTSSARIPHNRLLSDSEILKLELKDISATELERLCYLYYKAKGYKPELTKKGADGGIDLTYYHPQNGKTAVQVKQYIRSKNKISSEKIRELDSAKKNYGCVFSEFITTSTFTANALQEAPISMTTHDINWFESKVIPWMKRESMKNKYKSS